MAPKPLVAVTRPLPEAGMRILRESCEIRLWDDELPPPPNELDRLLDDADGVLSLVTDRIDGDMLDRHPSVKVISNFAVGYDNVDVDAATARGIPVCNTPGVLTEATAELAFSLLISTARRIPEAADYVRDGKWKTWGPLLLLGANVTSATIGIVGFGRIGQAVAKMASGFGMTILAHDRSPETKDTHGLDVRFVDIDTLLAEADFVTLHVAYSPETHHLIDADALRKMKKTAVLVNTARGPVVDTEALVTALENGDILAAGLDVTDPEPLPADHPLVAMPNCVVLPHIGSATVQSRDAMATMAARNLVAVLEGRQPEAIVNPEVLQR
jgi:glyoxylate reductase